MVVTRSGVESLDGWLQAVAWVIPVKIIWANEIQADDDISKNSIGPNAHNSKCFFNYVYNDYIPCLSHRSLTHHLPAPQSTVACTSTPIRQ